MVSLKLIHCRSGQCLVGRTGSCRHGLVDSNSVCTFVETIRNIASVKIKVGFGYDVHRLVEGNLLMIGGVEVPSTRGAEGHSDADVLVHAMCDALLGAAGLRDIGFHFPDTNPGYKGISSLVLLHRVVELLAEHQWYISNIDCTVVLQFPKISPYIYDMQQHIAQAAGVAVTDVSVKATTTETLGFTGTGEGIAAYAVALISNA